MYKREKEGGRGGGERQLQLFLNTRGSKKKFFFYSSLL